MTMSVTTKPAKLLAIDASTNNIAFALFSFGQIEAVGKIKFEGADIYQKCIDAAQKLSQVFKHPDFLNVDSLVIEHTVFMNSPKTAADLALVQGAIIGGSGMAGITTIGKVSPITWQNFLGNKKLTKDEQFALRQKNPGKSDSWYKSYEREFRKERTIKLIDVIYDRKITDHDIADACGIGHWALHNWDKAIGVDK